MLWRWAVRRHPRKGARWIKDRYFKVRGSRRWVFSTVEKYADGKAKEYALLMESDTSIVRHIKIKAAANPHDANWHEYFESRWGKKMLRSQRGRAKLYRVWQQQGGLCSTCQKPVTKDTPWDVHHIVKRAHGGADTAINLQIHHLRCSRGQCNKPMLKMCNRVPNGALVEA